MSSDNANRSLENPRAPADVPALLQAVRARTPARILVGRAGLAYRTATQLELRQDHAAALDAVHADLDIARDFERSFVDRWQLFEVQTQAADKTQYLMRPDLGRKLNDAARADVVRQCSLVSRRAGSVSDGGHPTVANASGSVIRGADVQVVIGDGLSAAAVIAQVPPLLPLIAEGVEKQGWSLGRPFVVRFCRVGVLNAIGELLDPAVVVLLIGERPGLATAVSLSAYMAYRPRPGHSDAQRNLISNIHERGVPIELAAQRIVSLAVKMRQMQASGVSVKEDLTVLSGGRPRLENQSGA